MGYPRVSAKVKHVSIIIIKPKIILDYSRKSDYNTEPEAFADSINTFLEEKMKKTKRLLALLCAVLIFTQVLVITASAASYPFLERGSKGNSVTILQVMLNRVNSANLVPDGDFGRATYNAVVAFQKKMFPNDRSQWDGKVGPKTWEKLIGKYQYSITLRANNRCNDVKILQIMLNKIIGAGLSVDGVFGQKTYEAVVRFQKKAFPYNSGEWDGVVGSKTWAKLFSYYFN